MSSAGGRSAARVHEGRQWTPSKRRRLVRGGREGAPHQEHPAKPGEHHLALFANGKRFAAIPCEV
eukprot:scaffold112453_cov48-Phaeocystis_antarctica.AAC.1